ncbi:MAG: glycosyltransferase family 39 protein [Chloroflexota bacterium]|nr:glycosyltransferase family 39 protein [Chloroflexota bacterium]
MTASRPGLRRIQWLALLAPMGMAAVWMVLRAQHITDWPSGFRPTQDYDSASAARTIWFALTQDSLLPWQRAWLVAKPGRFIEPPILQALTALTYLPDGVERPWTSTIFNSVAWLLAAGLLLDLCRRSVGWVGALLAFGFFLLAPFGNAVTQSFQPESLGVLALVGTMWYCARRDVLASWGAVGFAAALTGIVGLVKPGVLTLPIAGVLAVSSLRTGMWADRRRIARLACVVVLSAVPSAAYGVLTLGGQLDAKVIPGLLVTGGYYAGWWTHALRVAGPVPLIAAVAGYALSPALRRIGGGLFVGYLAASLVFTWHTMTHDYYQLPLLIVVAVGAAGLGEMVGRALRSRTWRAGAAVAAVVAAAVLIVATAPRDLEALTGSTGADAARYAALGDRLGRAEKVIAATAWYGYPLMYYSRLLVTAWPTADDIVFEAARGIHLGDEARLARMMASGAPRYFVITLQPDRVRDLVQLLGQRYPLLCGGERLLVYDLQNPAHLPPHIAGPRRAAPCNAVP